MCTVSMIGDHYHDKWQPKPWFPPPASIPNVTYTLGITREEFDALKKEVLDLKELLKRAKDYDEKNGEPDCETDAKLTVLRAVAKAVGIDLDDVLKPKPPAPEVS